MAVRLDTREIGRPGLRTAGGVVLDDFLNEVRGELGRRLYREMADNDPVCGAMLFALSQLFRAAEWDIDPADDTPAAEDAKDWLYAMLFEDMEHTWADLLD